MTKGNFCNIFVEAKVYL